MYDMVIMIKQVICGLKDSPSFYQSRYRVLNKSQIWSYLCKIGDTDAQKGTEGEAIWKMTSIKGDSLIISCSGTCQAYAGYSSHTIAVFGNIISPAGTN